MTTTSGPSRSPFDDGVARLVVDDAVASQQAGVDPRVQRALTRSRCIDGRVLSRARTTVRITPPGIDSLIDAWHAARLQHSAVYTQLETKADSLAVSVGPDGRVRAIQRAQSRMHTLAEIDDQGIRVIDPLALSMVIAAPRTWSPALAVTPREGNVR